MLGMKPEIAKETLLGFGKILDEAGIKFWLHGGTLLGAIREGSFIPGDWDIDLIALAGDWKPEIVPKIQALFDSVDLRRDGLYPFGYRKIVIKRRRAALSILFYLYYAPKNVFVFPKRFGGKLVDDPRWCEISPALLETEIFIEFVGQKFRIPDKSEELLEIMYGPTWRESRLRGWNVRRTFKIIPPREYIPWILKHPKEAMRGMG